MRQVECTKLLASFHSIIAVSVANELSTSRALAEFFYQSLREAQNGDTCMGFTLAASIPCNESHGTSHCCHPALRFGLTATISRYWVRKERTHCGSGWEAVIATEQVAKVEIFLEDNQLKVWKHPHSLEWQLHCSLDVSNPLTRMAILFGAASYNGKAL